MSEREEVAEVLRYARDVVLSDESKWYQGGSGVPQGKSCAQAAVGRALQAKNQKAYPRTPVERLADAALLDALPAGFNGLNRFVWVFNDNPNTTYSDVIDLFDLAIKSLEDLA